MEKTISQDVSPSSTMDRRRSSPNRGFTSLPGIGASSLNRSLIDMEMNQPDETEGFAYPELCQTDRATLSCALAHLQSKPDRNIVGEFSPFVSLDSIVLSDLKRRIHGTGFTVTDSVTNTDRRPVFALMSRMVGTAPMVLATVVLPREYEQRALRVAVRETEPETVWQAAYEAVIQRLEDYELDVPAPEESELDVVAVDAALDQAGSRLSLLWKADPQTRIPESVHYNNTVEVVPERVDEEFALQKIVTFICPDQMLARFVVRADEDGEAVMKAVNVVSRRYRGISYSWLNSAVFIDTVVQSDGSAFVVHVS